jgi:hypothetical protein
MVEGPRKKPCRYCRKWFRPDSRVGKRQFACDADACQEKRRAHTQLNWRTRHPDYDVARRILARSSSVPPRSAGPPVPPLNQLPWDMAQDLFSAQGAVFIAQFGKVLCNWSQDQLAAYAIETTGVSRKVGGEPVQDQMSIPP